MENNNLETTSHEDYTHIKPNPYLADYVTWESIPPPPPPPKGNRLSSTCLYRHYMRVMEGIFSKANCSNHFGCSYPILRAAREMTEARPSQGSGRTLKGNGARGFTRFRTCIL